MPLVTPTAPTALPTPPSTSSPLDFDVKADAFLGALPTNQTQINQLATDTYTNASYAQEQATTAAAQASTASAQAANAAASATAAAAAGNAAQYSSGTNYTTIGTVVWSPITFLSYRKKNGTSITNQGDPSVNTTNWASMAPGVPDFVLQSYGVI